MHYFVEVKKFITFVIMAKLMCSHRASGFIANISRPVNCQGSTAAIDFDFDLAGGSIISGSKVWLFNQYPIAQDTGSGFTALNNYTSRLTSHSGDGLTLSNVTTADAGSYKYELVLVAGFIPKTATASFTVYIGPLNPSSPLGCLVKASQVGSTVKCTVSGNCGTPPLIPSWINVATTDHFECKDSGTYQCCATGAVLPLCYSGSSNDFCTQFKCESKQGQLELGLGLGLGLGIQCVITIIVVVIFIVTGYKYAYILGLVHGVGLGTTFQVGWIIIASIISTGTTSSKLELGLALGLGSGIPCLIAGIIAVIFIFFSFPLFKDIPKRVELGKGILTGLLVASVIGSIVVYLKYHKLKREPTNTKHEDHPPGTDDDKSKPKKGQNPEHVPLDQTDKKSKTNNSGAVNPVK